MEEEFYVKEESQEKDSHGVCFFGVFIMLAFIIAGCVLR